MDTMKETPYDPISYKPHAAAHRGRKTMLTTKERVAAEAKLKTNGCWTFEDKDAQVWRNRAAMFEKQGRQTEANEAYVIASYLEDVPIEVERQWWETNGDRVLHIVAAMVTGRPQIGGAEDLIAMAAQIVRAVTDRAAHPHE